MITQAFVLGAGLGNRLRPLTEELPKPLVPVFGKPLITFAFDHLIAAGIDSFVVNTHHLPERWDDSLGRNSYRGCALRLVHEPILLETGGGIKNAEPFLTAETLIVYSGDVLTDLPLAPLIETHFRARNDVTLALRSTGVASQVAFRDGRIVDIAGRLGHPGNYDHANVSIWNRNAFARFRSGEKVSYVPVLVDWIAAGGRIGGIVIEEGRWFNLTSPRDYLELHRVVATENWRPVFPLAEPWPVPIAPDATIDPQAKVIGFSCVGAGSIIGAQAVIEDSILWPGSQIAPCARLKRCIVRTDRHVEGEQRDAII